MKKLFLLLSLCLTLTASTQVSKDQLKPLFTLVAKNIIEEPSSQTGNRFHIVYHDYAYAFKFYKNGILLRNQVQYTIEPVSGSSYEFYVVLPANLNTGDWVTWERWQ